MARRAVVDGIVSDTNLVPLATADVSILRTEIRISTGANGRFRITSVPAGQYALVVRRLGYQPVVRVVDIADGDTLRVSILLEPAAPSLDTVTVTARRMSSRMAEFEARRAKGEGQFMTAEEIHKRNSVRVTELIRTFRSVSVRPTDGPGGQYRYLAVSGRNPITMPRKGVGSPLRDSIFSTPCYMRVFVDGVPMPTPFDLDLLPSPLELAGIEVYASPATVPLEFKVSAGTICGVILVWTREGD